MSIPRSTSPSAVKVEPNNLDAHLTLVRSLMVRPGDLPRAEAEVKRLVAAYPGVPDVQSAFGTYLMARGEYGPARRAFSRALELQPSHIDALGGLAALDF